jgi:WD40 repeat protein
MLIEALQSSLPVLPRLGTSPDGTRTAQAGHDGVTITEVATGTVIARLPGPANAVAWSPDGARLAVALRNGTVKIWGEE